MLSANPPPPRLKLELPASDRHAADRYNAAFAGVFDTEFDRLGFHCQSEKVHIGSAVLSRSRSTPQIFRRSDRLARGTDIHSIQIILDIAGSWRGDYDGRSARGGPGTVRFVDSSRPFSNESESFETIGLFLPRAALGTDWAGKDLHGLVLSQPSPMTWLLKSHLRYLWDSVDSMNVEDAEATSEVVGVLAASALRGHFAAEPDGGRAFELTVSAMARRYIDAHLSHWDLTPEAIGAHLGISVRTLQRAFQDVGGVSAYIQGRRLDRARSAIMRAPGRTFVPDICYANGFLSDAKFRDAFRARFGVQPDQLAWPAPCEDETYGSTFLDWCRSL